MKTVIVIVVAVIICAGTVAGAFAYLWREKSRGEREQEAAFREALMARLRKRGYAGLDFPALVRESDVSPRIAERVAHQLYAEVCAKVVADGVITDDEWKTLSALRQALTIPDGVAQKIETAAKEDRYRTAAMSALADGVITAQEEAELESMRASLGLSSRRANDIVGGPARDGYLALFRKVISDGRITPGEWQELHRFRNALGISRDEANDIVRNDALGLYRQWFTNVIQDGEVTAEEEEGLKWLRAEFGLDPSDTERYDARLDEIKRLSAYRRGELPRLRTSKLLEGGEICHWEGRASFEWSTATQVKAADGELIITSQRLIFASPTRSFEFAPSKIIDIRLYSDALVLQCSSRVGGGTYYVRHPADLEAILVGVAKVHKYQTSAKYSSDQTRHIPDSVRRDVWHRDGGKCVRCAATDYLEFDHIIPHAKGGANTVGNVQLLCRRCNNHKRDRI